MVLPGKEQTDGKDQKDDWLSHGGLPAAGGGGVLPARRGGDGAVRAGYRGGRRCGRAVCGRLRAAPDEGRGRGIKNSRIFCRSTQ